MEIPKQLWNKFQSLKTWQKALALFMIFAVVGSFAGTSNSTLTSNTSSGIDVSVVEPDVNSTLDELNASSVKWNNYSPAVKQRIAGFIDTGDCTNLQVEFDNASNNNAAQRNRTGEGNVDLMALLDAQMRKLRCY